MSVAFDCNNCGAHFDVDSRLAGRAGRCRKCGVKMTIPRVREREPVAAAAAPGNWLEAVTSQVALKPLTIEKFPALKRSQLTRSRHEDEDDTPGPYGLLGPVPAEERRGRAVSPVSGLKVFYYHRLSGFRGLLRWIADSAYMLSIPCIMLLLMGIILKNRPLALAGATGIVVLNLIRLVSLLSQMAVVPFRESFIQGVLFYIPPFTFFVLSKHWKSLKRSAKKLIEPAVTILLVFLAFTYVPWLYTGKTDAKSGASRLRSGVTTLKKDMLRDLDRLGSQAGDAANKIEAKLPRPEASQPNPR